MQVLYSSGRSSETRSVETVTSMHVRLDTSRACHCSAGINPRSSSMDGRKSSDMFRTMRTVFFSFARGKQIVAILGAPDIDLSDVILSEDLADFRAEERLAFAHGFDCLDEIALGRIFQQVVSRAGFQRAEAIPLVGMHTQNDDCRLGKLSADPLRRLDAAQFRHCDIENHNLGPCSKSVFDRLISV